MGDDPVKIAAGLTGNEKARLIEGRRDWREDRWQDHCGDIDCEYCYGSLIPEGTPRLLSPEDQAIRAHLLKPAEEEGR